MLFRVGLHAYISNLVRIGLSMCPRCRYTGLVYMGGTRFCGPIKPIFNTLWLWLIEAHLQCLKFVALCVRTQSWLEFRADQMSLSNVGSVFLFVPHVLTKLIYPLWGGYKKFLNFIVAATASVVPHCVDAFA